MKYLIMITIVLIGMTSCKEEEVFKSWMDKTSKLRDTARIQAEIEPYRKEQFQALKDYFAELNNVALLLKKDKKFREGFNKGAIKKDFQEVCDQVLIQKIVWNLMIVRCTRNNFFLCAEEVRAYPDMVTIIRESLNKENLAKFDKAPSCHAAVD